MEPATLALLLQLAAQLLALAKREIDLAKAGGTIAPEMLERIRREAAEIDARWDALVAAARLRHQPDAP